MSRLAAHMELARIIDRNSDVEGASATALAGLNCLKMYKPGLKMPTLYKPSFCMIVQGSKNVLLGEETYRYGVGDYLTVAVDLPVLGQVTEATAEKPYLGISIELDAKLLSEMLAQGGITLQGEGSGSRGMFVGKSSDVLVDTVLRLVRLLETPQDIAVMGPLLLRELHYRLLSCEHSAQIVQVALHGSAMQRIGQVIAAIQRDFDKTIRVDDLAGLARMSVSSFHHHFKEVTAMSPLQYQKQLRLMEARRLMLAERRTAADAAYGVGYESSSQFSREYARFFGLPPAKDVGRLLAV